MKLAPDQRNVLHLRLHLNELACALVLALTIINLAKAQAPDFLHPQQKGPFAVKGLNYEELFYTENVQLEYPVPSLTQTIAEIKATGANLVKLQLAAGIVRNNHDNAYDPSLPPNPGSPSDIIAFLRRLVAEGIACHVQAMSLLHNAQLGAGPGHSDRPDPSDRRAFLTQHIPRLVNLAQMAESAGCEYFGIFNDDIEYLVRDSSLADLWIQAITEVRKVFSGRLTSVSAWGELGGGFAPHDPLIAGLLDVWGIGFNPAYTDHANPTVAELVASYRKNAAGRDSLQGVTDLHTLYGKPILITDMAYASFSGSSLGSIWGPGPFKVDFQEQANLYTAFFQVMPSLDPNWMLGATFDSYYRIPYEWLDSHLGPASGTPGVNIRGKPAQQILTQAYQTSHPMATPANGWWYNPANPGFLYALEAENGVVRLARFQFSTQGDPEWNLARCVQVASGQYSGRLEQYSDGQALNRPPAQPTGVVDGAAVTITFSSAATATLQIGTQSIPVQRYQFSDQWASPRLNAPRTGWWDRPEQSGRGYFMEVQGNTVFLGGLIYTSSGRPTWFTSTGPMDSTGNFSANLTVCSTAANSGGSLQPPVCKATTDTIRLAFSAPWRATLTLGQEAPVEIRRYRLTEIGWAGPAPSFAYPKPAFVGLGTVVNAASFQLGLSPGSVASIIGTGLTRGVNGVVQPVGGLPTTLHGTSVLLNGIPAPLFALANTNGQEQINFQVPYELKGQTTATVIVVNNGTLSPPMRAQVFDAQPGIITSDGSHAVAVRPDYSLVTTQNPARPGDVITLYGTGFGPVTPLPATGAPAGLEPLSTMNPAPVLAISGNNATVQFAGLTPGFVGLYQFNTVLPGGLGTGDLPVLMRAGGQLSNLVLLPVQGQPGVQIELLRNGSFSDPFGANWGLALSQGAAATVDRPAASSYDGSFSAHISITTASSVPFPQSIAGVQFFQRGIPVTQGVTYQLQFWAKSSNARTMRVNVRYGLSAAAFSLGSEWQHYVAYFQATDSAPDGQVGFLFGEQTGDVWLDDVSLTPVLGP